MNFLWPQLIWLFLLVPILVGVYVWVLRRKRKFAVNYSSLSLIREALPKYSRWRQHLPFGLFLLGLACLIAAINRPTAEVVVPANRTTVILAIDVSRSMCATDVSPNRLSVAQDAALKFIEEQAGETRIGLVAFAGFAEIIVPPTNDKAALTEAIQNFTTSLGTAIGSATLKSIDAIAEINEDVEYSGVDLGLGEEFTPLDINYYEPDIIVVLTDGANSEGPRPLEAALQAAHRQVRIYTIGFGSDNPGRMVCSPEQMGSDTFQGGFGRGFGGGFGGPGGGFQRYLLLDEDTLLGMAELTGGAYYRAEDADQLFEVFTGLPNEINFQRERIEISALFSILGVLFAIAAAALSLIWHRFP